MNTITDDELREHLYTLASDDFEGRKTATRGQKIAARYLSNYYFTTGLKGPVKNQANPYLQNIDFLEEKTSYGSLKAQGIELLEGKDFISQSAAIKTDPSELAFVGHGMELPEYDDYSDLDVRGKAIVAIWGNPVNSEGKRLFNTPQDSFLNLARLSEKGITDLFITMPTQERYDSQAPFLTRGANKFKPVFLLDESDLSDRPYNLHFISPSRLATLFGISAEEYFQAVSSSLDERKPLGGIFSSKDIKLEVVRPRKTISSENVIAYVEGSDLKDEVLVISSHYDHIGIINNKIYNGADDDGSGTVTVLEIAEAFAIAAREGNRQRRTVVFLNLTGEEIGLYGSEYYADQEPIFPLEKTIANLNIDMVGRVDKKHADNENYVYIIGSDMLSTDLHKVHENVSTTYFPKMEMDYFYNGKSHPDRFYYRSDHYNFAKNNIPVIFYFNGTHEDYHQHTDTPDKIKYEVMANRARLIFATAWHLANEDDRPVVDKAE